MELEHEADLLVAEGVQLPRGAGEHVAVAHAYRPGRGAVQGAEAVQEGGLAGARLPEDGDPLARLQHEVDPAEDRKRNAAFHEDLVKTFDRDAGDGADRAHS